MDLDFEELEATRKKKCEYCEKEKRIEELTTDNIYLEIYGKHLRLNGKVMGIRFGRDFMINYCPMCGRKLRWIYG